MFYLVLHKKAHFWKYFLTPTQIQTFLPSMTQTRTFFCPTRLRLLPHWSFFTFALSLFSHRWGRQWTHRWSGPAAASSTSPPHSQHASAVRCPECPCVGWQRRTGDVTCWGPTGDPDQRSEPWKLWGEACGEACWSCLKASTHRVGGAPTLWPGSGLQSRSGWFVGCGRPQPSFHRLISGQRCWALLVPVFCFFPLL